MPYLTVNGKKLNYADTKPGDSGGTSSERKSTTTVTTIVFVHGLGSTQNYFFPILPYLSEYRCILLDSYGAGRSRLNSAGEREQEQEHSIETIGKDVIGIMDALGVQRAVVVGYSMGGMVPTWLAAKESARVLAGVCIGPVHPSPAVAEVFKKRIPAVREGGMEAMANTIPGAATGSKATPLMRAFIREMLMAQDPAGYILNCHAIETAQPPDYAAVKCPILIIAGDEDKSAPLSGCEFILGELGTASEQKRLEVLKGVGHWHCVEAPEEVGALVREFVEGLPDLGK